MNHRLNEKGFTFLSSLFELMLLLLFLPLMVIFFLFVRGFFSEADPQTAEWFLFAGELQSYLTGIDSIAIINNGGGVRILQRGNEYDIESYDKFIRKQKFQQGHEVMLTKVKKTTFSLQGNRLMLRAEFTNGKILEEVYVYTYP